MTTSLPDALLSDDRSARLDRLMWGSFALYQAALEHTRSEGKQVAATCLLFSGGNDSTVLAHMFRKLADYAVHINTGIGIEQTREFVRDTCAGWGLELIERHPPAGSTYREQVLAHGFPGPAHHWKMYQRLKERALRQVRRELVTNGHKQRVIFLAGRRRAESERRKARDIPAVERVDSVVWVSPLLDWHPLDLNTYRMRYPDCPTNPVTELLHMSGECLCGSFAKPEELDEIGTWFPEKRAEIEALQDEVRAAGHPEARCRWGWGAHRQRPSRTGPMCSSCTLFDSIDDIPREGATR